MNASPCAAPAGRYCPSSSAFREGTLCPAGSSCAGGGARPIPCAALPGRFCPSGCTTDAGEPCPAGYYCIGGISKPEPCTAAPGSYCAPGSVKPDGIPCPSMQFGMSAFCCAGGSLDKQICPAPLIVTRQALTPSPKMCVWLEHRSLTQALCPSCSFALINSFQS